ncbi:hypothetical protein D9M68_946070 [compost metagenome]
MPMMAATLMIENQNSISPKDFTLDRLIALITRKNTSAEIHVGISGHQYCT